MSSLVELLERDTTTLMVSLPGNNVELAKAALAGGAEALKVHVNTHHAASRVHFGTLDEERKSLEAILKVAEDVPVGIMAGGDEPLTKDDFNLLQSFGFDFLNLYAHKIPVWAWLDETFVKLAAVDSSYTTDEIIALNNLMPDIVEVAVIPESGYGQPMTVRDLMQYRIIHDILDWPMVVPTQRRLLPEEVPALQKIGIRGLMIGAMVTGTDPHGLEAAAGKFRQVIDAAR